MEHVFIAELYVMTQTSMSSRTVVSTNELIAQSSSRDYVSYTLSESPVRYVPILSRPASI